MQPLAHLLGGFVGEGYSENARGGDPLFEDKLGHSVCKHSSLATSSASENKNGTVSMRDSSRLRLIEPLGEVRLRS
jgi:hypothetical protein